MDHITLAIALADLFLILGIYGFIFTTRSKGLDSVIRRIEKSLGDHIEDNDDKFGDIEGMLRKMSSDLDSHMRER